MSRKPKAENPYRLTPPEMYGLAGIGGLALSAVGMAIDYGNNFYTPVVIPVLAVTALLSVGTLIYGAAYGDSYRQQHPPFIEPTKPATPRRRP